jgi:hypothetical protein
MIKIEDYISDIYVDYIIEQYEYQFITGEKCYLDKGDDIYKYGVFYDGNKYYTVNILGGSDFLRKKIRDIKLNKILKNP